MKYQKLRMMCWLQSRNKRMTLPKCVLKVWNWCYHDPRNSWQWRKQKNSLNYNNGWWYSTWFFYSPWINWNGFIYSKIVDGLLHGYVLCLGTTVTSKIFIAGDTFHSTSHLLINRKFWTLQGSALHNLQERFSGKKWSLSMKYQW